MFCVLKNAVRHLRFLPRGERDAVQHLQIKKYAIIKLIRTVPCSLHYVYHSHPDIKPSKFIIQRQWAAPGKCVPKFRLQLQGKIILPLIENTTCVESAHDARCSEKHPATDVGTNTTCVESAHDAGCRGESILPLTSQL